MPFRSGSVSYARFRVTGGPAAVTTALLETIAGAALDDDPSGAPGPRPDLQAGWTGGRHVLDRGFDAEHVVFGSALLFGMRVDERKVPAELRQAWRALAEQAYAQSSPTGVVSRQERAAAREEAEERCRREVSTGRFTRSRHVPVLWDLDRHVLLAPVFGEGMAVVLRDLVRTTFNAGLEPLSAGTAASACTSRRGGARGGTRDFEDLEPTPFTDPPIAATTDDGRLLRTPLVPWSRHGDGPKDFIGNEFLLWLWAHCEPSTGLGSGMIDTPRGAVGVTIERSLVAHCAWEATGHLTLEADAPTRLAEAGVALATGKWPRKCGLVIAAPDGEQWTLTFQADRFNVTSARLPRPEEAPASPRDALEMRVQSILALDQTLDALFETFIERRLGEGWRTERGAMREWIGARRGSKAAPVPTPAPALGERIDIAPK